MNHLMQKWIAGTGLCMGSGITVLRGGSLMPWAHFPGAMRMSSSSWIGQTTVHADMAADWSLFRLLNVETFSQLSSQQLVHLMYVLIGAVLLALLGLLLFILIHQHNSRRRLETIAYIDPVTKGWNYSKLKQEAKRQLFDSYTQTYALVSIDVARFKALNDVYGYERGNEILKDMSNAIAEHLTGEEMHARMVADNFTLLMKFETEDILVSRLQAMVDMIHKQITTPHLQIAVGYYVIKDPTLDFSLMNDRANMAKKESKRNPNRGFVCYQDYMRDTILLESELERDMQRALEQQEFEVYLQPKFHLPNGTICGAEALVRWNHPAKGILLPKEFIPLFEQNGFVRKLDFYVLNQVCELIEKWIDAGRAPYPISVNLSRLHMTDEKLAEKLHAIISQYRIPPQLIEFELTETTMELNTKHLIPTFLKMKELGFSVAIDDFGSGYSSLKLLKDIPADILKLDRGFLNRLETSQRERIVVENVIHLAAALNIRVVSEGVETLEQVEFLSEVGCDVAQGYFFAQPMPVQEFERMAYD